MKRLRSKSSPRMTRDAEKLISLSSSALLSASRTEDEFWQDAIKAQLIKLMERGNDAAIESALDQSFQLNTVAHELLAGAAESVAEACVIEHDADDDATTAHQALLIAIPLVAWSKYPIVWGPISASAMTPIIAHLSAHILARDTKALINPFLYAIDHLPRGFSETRKLTLKLAEAALAGKAAVIDYKRLGDAADLPADVRFLIGCVTAPVGAPLFRWQEDVGADAGATRTESLMRWVEQCRPALAKLVPGAAFECGLPDAYFHNCRESDRRVRPYTLSAAITDLQMALSLPTEEISAVIASVGDAQTDEYRVGLTRRGESEIYQGVVWPLFGNEDDDANPSPRQEILEVLKACNVGDVVTLTGLQPPEFCEDCGAPLFFNSEAEAVHAEMPEDSERPSAHYH